MVAAVGHWLIVPFADEECLASPMQRRESAPIIQMNVEMKMSMSIDKELGQYQEWETVSPSWLRNVAWDTRGQHKEELGEVQFWTAQCVAACD